MHVDMSPKHVDMLMSCQHVLNACRHVSKACRHAFFANMHVGSSQHGPFFLMGNLKGYEVALVPVPVPVIPVEYGNFKGEFVEFTERTQP